MAGLARMVIGIPVLVLQDAEGMTVTIETRSDDTYRGFLASVEDCMNCRLSNVFVTRRDGSTMHLDHIFVPGRQIRLVVLPQILEKAPVFGRVRDAKDGKEHVRGLGRGRYLARDAMRAAPPAMPMGMPPMSAMARPPPPPTQPSFLAKRSLGA
ncbi:hypothetical protein FNF27_05059 [Cafeteria roenbergensis]|uniref:Small nuclear ribonucleoprotein Sm D3 n=1 Tax=Cafeteria roenbergensis TaxID=33653 RepID=A0A5A8E7F0_CAFRO|nr:hypothetical protein FNF27_05059 [Cafeteria roenbergensis]